MPHKTASRARGLGVGQRPILVMNAVTRFKQGHGEIRVFGNGVRLITTGVTHRRCAPGADRARHDRYHPEDIQGTPFEILAGEIFEGLPARPQIHLVGDLGIARHGCHLEVGKVGHQQ